MNKKRQADEMLTGSKTMRIFDNVGIWTLKRQLRLKEITIVKMTNVPSNQCQELMIIRQFKGKQMT